MCSLVGGQWGGDIVTDPHCSWSPNDEAKEQVAKESIDGQVLNFGNEFGGDDVLNAKV